MQGRRTKGPKKDTEVWNR